MIRTHELTVPAALGRLRWALAQPLNYGEPDWGSRMFRALAAVRHAVDRHLDSADAADLLFRSRRDPFLPFFAEPDSAAAEAMRGFQKRLTLLQLQAEEAARSAETAAPESATSVHAFRSLARVARDAEQLGGAMGAYFSRAPGDLQADA